VLRKLTVSDVVIDELEKNGIQFIFGIPGNSSLGLIEAIRKKPSIKYIIVRHEENAALAASAYNKLTGKIAACLTINGPGSANLTTGFYDAKEDHASLLSISGQDNIKFNNFNKSREIDQNIFFKSITVYNNTIIDKNDTVKILTQAIKSAALEHGAAHISIPSNIQKESMDPTLCEREYCLTNFNISPEDSEIEKAVELINQSRKPVIIAGWGSYNLGNTLEKLAQKISAPIITTFRAKGILSEENPWVGGILGFGTPVGNTLVKNADLLITLGVGFSASTPIPVDKPLIQVDIDPIKLGIHPYTVALWGNCNVIVPKILELVKSNNDYSNFEKLQAMKQKWFTQLKKEANPSAQPIRPPYIMKILSEMIPEDAIISIDIGDNAWWFGRNFISKKQRLVMSGYHHAMGFGLPGAIASKIAYPEKSVFCISGDGGFTMTMMDFITTIKYRIPIIFVIMNNQQYAMIQNAQKNEGFSAYGNDLLNPKFSQYADACGGIGYTVTKPEELSQYITKALKADRSTLIDIDTDPTRF